MSDLQRKRLLSGLPSKSGGSTVSFEKHPKPMFVQFAKAIETGFPHAHETR